MRADEASVAECMGMALLRLREAGSAVPFRVRALRLTRSGHRT
ncbi:hypothetical protein [Streptomyces sp. NEAU-W12]|nr:hypothetical protein [Streptomyces sp. NEAU-W12]